MKSVIGTRNPLSYPDGMRSITAYTDYKSPYAYLAKDPTYALEREFPIKVRWLPYILDIPSYLGSARLDEHGSVIESERNGHQWRRVRYSYMDCRRQANKRGLVIRGTRKIWDSRLAAAGMLYAQAQGPDVFRRYHDAVFDQFWRRDLDIEDGLALDGILQAAGATQGFIDQSAAMVAQVEQISRDAEAIGVFGVPSFVIDGELFWGREHLPDIRALLAQA